MVQLLPGFGYSHMDESKLLTIQLEIYVVVLSDLGLLVLAIANVHLILIKLKKFTVLPLLTFYIVVIIFLLIRMASDFFLYYTYMR